MSLSKLHLSWAESKYRNKVYRTYYLSYAYREDGKNKKKNIHKLGKLTEQEAKEIKQFLKILKTPNKVTTTLKDIVVQKHYLYLTVAVALEIWRYWELDKVFKKNTKKLVELSIITSILTINRCIAPTSKSQVSDWFAKTALPWFFNIDSELINSSRIFRELKNIEEHKEAICNHLFNKFYKKNPESMKSTFFDLSTTTFTGSKCILVNWGHCKEGFDYHTVLALLVNNEGLPFYWEVLPGNTADSKTLKWLIQYLPEKFKTNDITLVFDRGIVSRENLEFLQSENIKYITAMDKNQIENIAQIKFEDLNTKKIFKHGFKKLNKDTFYKEITSIKNRRNILCFSSQLSEDQNKARNQAIKDFEEFTKELNKDLLLAKKSREKKSTYSKFEKQLKKYKLHSFVSVKLTKVIVGKIHTYQGKISINIDKKRYASKLDGFWLLVSNHTEKDKINFKKTAIDLIVPYKEKVIIESGFRDIKSFVKISPVNVWTEDHVKAHYTICALSYLINRTLSLRLHENKGSDLTAHIVSHCSLYKELEDCLIDHIYVKNADLYTHNMSKASDIQLELLKRINLEHLANNAFFENLLNEG